MDDDELDGLDTIGHSKVSSRTERSNGAETHGQTVFYHFSAYLPRVVDLWLLCNDGTALFGEYSNNRYI